MSVFYKILSLFCKFFNSKYVIIYNKKNQIITRSKKHLTDKSRKVFWSDVSDELEGKNLFACDFEINKAVLIHCKCLVVKLLKGNKLNLAPLLA